MSWWNAGFEAYKSFLNAWLTFWQAHPLIFVVVFVVAITVGWFTRTRR